MEEPLRRLKFENSQAQIKNIRTTMCLIRRFQRERIQKLLATRRTSFQARSDYSEDTETTENWAHMQKTRLRRREETSSSRALTSRWIKIKY